MLSSSHGCGAVSAPWPLILLASPLRRLRGDALGHVFLVRQWRARRFHRGTVRTDAEKRAHFIVPRYRVLIPKLDQRTAEALFEQNIAREIAAGPAHRAD